MRKINGPLLVIIVSGIIIAVGLAIFATTSVKNRNFRMVSHDPNETATTAQPVYVNFNRVLSDETAGYFSISPDLLGRVDIDGASLIFTPSDNFRINQKYTVTISRAVAQDGSTIDDVSFSFTAGLVPVDQMTESQKSSEIAQTDSLEHKNPFLAKLPQETLGYKIDWHLLPPASGEGPETVLVEVNLYGTYNRPSQLESYKKELNLHKQQALDWIRSTGQDPAQLVIKYTPNPDNPTAPSNEL